MAEGRIRTGIGGWTYSPWRGVFYPDGLPQSRELEYASRQLGAIEINATFYGRQSPKSWQSWAQIVPDDFKFAVKGSRYCVTRPRLAEAGEGIEKFLSQGFTALGDKLGPILWMFAPRRQFDRNDIARFVDLLPEQQDGVPLHHVIEPRHESFRDDAFFELCRARNIAIVFSDDDEIPCIDVRTASFTYARLQRMSEDVPNGYDEAALDAFASKGREWSKDGRDCYLFMINGAKVRAPAAAVALAERLGR